MVFAQRDRHVSLAGVYGVHVASTTGRALGNAGIT